MKGVGLAGQREKLNSVAFALGASASPTGALHLNGTSEVSWTGAKGLGLQDPSINQSLDRGYFQEQGNILGKAIPLS